MTNFLHWRKATWALVLWSGYIATWTLITGPGPAMVALWWLAGMILLGSLLFATQPLFQQGPGLSGLFVWPGRTHWQVVNEPVRIETDRGAIGARALRNCEDEGGATLPLHGP